MCFIKPAERWRSNEDRLGRETAGVEEDVGVDVDWESVILAATEDFCCVGWIVAEEANKVEGSLEDEVNEGKIGVLCDEAGTTKEFVIIDDDDTGDGALGLLAPS